MRVVRERAAGLDDSTLCRSVRALVDTGLIYAQCDEKQVRFD